MKIKNINTNYWESNVFNVSFKITLYKKLEIKEKGKRSRNCYIKTLSTCFIGHVINYYSYTSYTFMLNKYMIYNNLHNIYLVFCLN